MERIFNFSAGPAALPQEVLEQAREELVNWRGCGMSVMEMSHRGKEYMGIQAEAEADLRELMGIPANYKVLFLQGGASSQFAMVPMNLYRGKASADYLNTGEWSKKAIKEAKKYGAVNVVASSEDKNFSYAPTQDAWKHDPNAAYVHYTSNETIGGVELFWTPQTGDVPLVADYLDGVEVKAGDLVLFENVRFNKGEKKNADELAQQYAALCDVFVMDAFGTAHRAEGSTHGVAKFAKVAAAGPILLAALAAAPASALRRQSTSHAQTHIDVWRHVAWTGLGLNGLLAPGDLIARFLPVGDAGIRE